MHAIDNSNLFSYMRAFDHAVRNSYMSANEVSLANIDP
jgi:hypothetical protein